VCLWGWSPHSGAFFYAARVEECGFVAPCRDPFKAKLDSACGVCIILLYFLYFVIVKGALSVFDCSQNKDGVLLLDADPSIKCNEVRSREKLCVFISVGKCGCVRGSWVLRAPATPACILRKWGACACVRVCV
jgi:hypothetical protein